MNRSINLQLRSFDATARTVDCIASTDAIDSYGESVDQETWSLTRFVANPVVLFGHDAHALPIGRASDVRVERGALRAKIHFASAAANPLAEQCFQLVKEGALSAVSVGFVPGKVTTEKRGGDSVVVLSDNELHEISVVPLPANPDALMRSKAADLRIGLAAAKRGTAGLDGSDPVVADLGDLVLREIASERNMARLNADAAGAERDAAAAVAEIMSRAPEAKPITKSSDGNHTGDVLAHLALKHAASHQ
jgi:HK97 family phage prohead protease